MPVNPPLKPGQRGMRWGVWLGIWLGVVVFAPARWLALGVDAASQGRVQLRDAQGTLWRGHAQWVLTSGPGGQDALALPERLHWRLAPQWHASLVLRLQVAGSTPEPIELSLTPSLQGLQLRLTSAHSVWPAQWLSGLGAPWNTMNLTGQMHLRSQGLLWTWQGWRGQLSGQAQLDLIDMASALSTVQPLGSYSLQLQGGEVPTVLLKTQQGKLRLQGSGVWQPQGFRFEGLARSDSDNDSALRTLLGVLGQRNGNTTVLRWG
ncbi:MAG: type II secretion system protein N [Betaproteobacteria bacterium]|nr:type II secretion system protein N [Betaproteobacteria bacterium]